VEDKMKTRKFNKKMALNKKTVANLNHLNPRQMKDLKGGNKPVDTDTCCFCLSLAGCP
jgi:hypothetical protein